MSAIDRRLPSHNHPATGEAGVHTWVSPQVDLAIESTTIRRKR